MKDYYLVLGIQPNAAADEIRTAYRDKVQFYHPDRWQDSPQMHQKAEDRTKEINEAFEVLGNPTKRAQYDREHASQVYDTAKEYERHREEAEQKRRAEEEITRQRADHDRKKREQAKGAKPLSWYLEQAESLVKNGSLERAAEILEEAHSANPTWAPKIAGFPRQTILAQSEPVSGYALLVHIAGKTGRKKLAAQYVKRMLELNPESPGDGHARQAAREARVEKEARDIAKAMGFTWRWWEY